jgi:hypothetical protein
VNDVVTYNYLLCDGEAERRERSGAAEADDLLSNSEKADEKALELCGCTLSRDLELFTYQDDGPDLNIADALRGCASASYWLRAERIRDESNVAAPTTRPSVRMRHAEQVTALRKATPDPDLPPVRLLDAAAKLSKRGGRQREGRGTGRDVHRALHSRG